MSSVKWANHTDRRVTANDAARITALHVRGVVRTLGVERASLVLDWLGWPKESFERVHNLTAITPLHRYFLSKFKRTLP